MVYVMRKYLRNTVDDILSSGISNSFKVPDTITNWITRAQATTMGNATWLLYQSTKTPGVTAGNRTDINNCFTTSEGQNLGRILGATYDQVNGEVTAGNLLDNLEMVKSVSAQASNLGYTQYDLNNYYGILNGKLDAKFETCVRTIELCPAAAFATAIGYINDLTTSCNGGWGGLGYISLNDAVTTLTGLLAPEIVSIAALTTSIVGDSSVTGTTVKTALVGSHTAAGEIYAQLGLESTNKTNLADTSLAFSSALSIQSIGADGEDPLFNILLHTTQGPARDLFLTAPSILLANSSLAPLPNESETDTFYRVCSELTIPSPAYNPTDVIYKAAAYDNTIYDKYLNPAEFDPENREHIIKVLDQIASDFSIDPCGGNRQLRLKYLRDYLDNLELNLLKERITEVRNMLTD